MGLEPAATVGGVSEASPPPAPISYCETVPDPMLVT